MADPSEAAVLPSGAVLEPALLRLVLVLEVLSSAYFVSRQLTFMVALEPSAAMAVILALPSATQTALWPQVLTISLLLLASE